MSSGKVIQYIGRKTDFRGKTLWEIVGDMKNYGVGRLIKRNMFQRYPEPCYMRILKVETVDGPLEENPDNVRKVMVTVEKTWRGNTLPKPVKIFRTSYKADYELIDEADEHKYLSNSKKVREKILPREIPLPPLLREFIRDETGIENPTMKLHFVPSYNKFVRVAKEGETPNTTWDIGVGVPAPEARHLYDGVL